MSSATATEETVPSITYSEEEILDLFTRLYEAYQDPKIELDHSNSFTLLIAVILAAQSTDKRVNLVTPQLFELADSPAKMLDLGIDRLTSLIRTVGLFKSKASNIIALSRKLLDSFNGHVPANKEDLMSLPGVGAKTANVVLNECFGIPTIAVDTHVFRLANRLGLAPGNTPQAVETKLMEIIPPSFRYPAHRLLVFHGRYTCKARRPVCSGCVIRDICKAPISLTGSETPVTAA